MIKKLDFIQDYKNFKYKTVKLGRNERWKRESIENGLREESKEENTISIIKSMLNKKTDYKFISEITGKTIKEIKEIENNM